MKTQLSTLFILSQLLSFCSKDNIAGGSIAQPPLSTQATEHTSVAVKGDFPIKSFAEFLAVPETNLPFTKNEPGWKTYTKTPGIELLMPASIPLDLKPYAEGANAQTPWPRNGYKVLYKDIMIKLLRSKNTPLADYIKVIFSDDKYSPVYHSVTYARKITQPKPGYYVEQKYGKDQVIESFFADGQDTIIFMTRFSREEPFGFSGLTAEDVKKIHLSLKFTGANP